MDWFGGLRVLSLESRRSEEMATLIQKYGGVATVAPSMREQKLDLGAALASFEAALLAGDIHAVTCMTGVGTRLFLRDLLARDPALLERLGPVPFVLRGSKPAQALRTFGLSGVSVPRPHTWHEVQDHLLATLSPGQHTVILEYGEAPPVGMLRTLAQAGIRVTSVPVYRCAFPHDTLPMARAIRDTVLFGQDVLLLSSGTQVLHLLKFAARINLEPELRTALDRMVVVSIGPACSESAAELGLRIDLEANPHKMGILVRTAAEHGPAILRSRLGRVG